MDNQEDRIPTSPPDAFEDDKSAREFGRQLAIDSLLGEAFTAESSSSEEKPKTTPMWPRMAAAAAILIGLGVLWSLFNQGDDPDPNYLARGWKIEPVGDAVYALHQGRVLLKHGELLVYSDPDEPDLEPLTIETPHAEATATGTRFYIGAHDLAANPNKTNPSNTMIKQLTRILVLSGTVSLSTPSGTATANADELLVAKDKQKPENLAVRANSEFAIDLYRELSKENRGNLFFSPYSISSALAMCAEGARGETAAEMGKVLHFPEAARRIGDDAQLIPWETAKIHAGLSQLNRLLQTDDTPEKKAIREKISSLRSEHVQLQKDMDRLSDARTWDDYRKKANRERELVRELNQLLPQVDQYNLNVANALWGEKSHHFRADYVKTIEDSYGTGGVFPADFVNDTDAERKRINAWAADQTDDLITEVLPPGSLSPMTRLLITNAIYFNGAWKTPFRESFTEEADFFTAPGAPVKVSMMRSPWLDKCRYASFNADGSFFETPEKYRKGTDPNGYPIGGGFSMAELPYKGDDLSMVVLSPIEKDGLGAIEESLDTDKLDRWISQLRQRATHIFLPKFQAEESYGLNDHLTKLGMPTAFSPGADFSGMSESSEALFIGGVLHKAVITVNEEGTKAAAVTAVEVSKKAERPVEMIDFTPTFRADRPFLFLIRDNRSGSILFLGRITAPE